MQNGYFDQVHGLANKFVDQVHALANQFAQPTTFYQLGILALCLFAAYRVSIVLKRWLGLRSGSLSPILQFSLESLSKATFPLLGWLFVLIARALLGFAAHAGVPIDTTFLRVALGPLFGIALIYLLFSILDRLFIRDGKPLFLLAPIQAVVKVLVWSGVALYVLGLSDDLHHWMEGVHFNILDTHMTLLTLCTRLAWVAVAMIVAYGIALVLEGRLMRVSSMDANLKAVLIRISKAILLLIALLFSFTTLFPKTNIITALGVFGGALGVGLGFGLQKIASNYISGFIILLDRSLRLGDQITVGSYQGIVTQIKTRYTVVRSLDGVETIIPNEKLVIDPVQNHTSYITRGFVKLPVQVAYTSDIDLAMKLLVDATRGVDRVLSDPAPSASLTDFGADGINLAVGFWVANAAEGVGSVRSNVNKNIWKLFLQHDISIPFSQREVRIIGEVPLSRADSQPADETTEQVTV